MKKSTTDNIIHAIQYYKEELTFIRHHRRRSKVLNKISELQRYCLPDEAVRSAEHSYSYAQETHDPRTIGASILAMGECLLWHGEVEEASHLALEAEKQFEKIDHAPGFDDLQLYKWSIGILNGSYRDILQAYEPFWDKWIADNQLEKAQRLAATVAQAYYYTGEYHLSIEYMGSAIQLSRQLGHSWQIGSALVLLGMATIACGKGPLGLAQLVKAYEHSNSISDNVGECLSLLAMSIYNATSKNTPEAHAKLSRAKYLAANLGYKSIAAECAFAEAVAARYSAPGEEAIRLAVIAHNSAITSNEVFKILQSLQLLGIIYVENGNNTQATNYFKQALELAERHHSIDYQQQLLQRLAVLCEVSGEPERANDLYRKYIGIASTYHQSILAVDDLALSQPRPMLSSSPEVQLEPSASDSIQLVRSIMNQYPMLTTSEAKVYSMVFEQYSNKEIAEKLSLSIRTVENHRYHIRRKLGVKSGSKKIELPVNINKYL